MIELRSASRTDVGLVRENNEDELLVAAPLFAVADGMGGAAAGEVASSTAIKTLQEAFDLAGHPSAHALLGAAQAANRAVWERAEANPEMRGMGTTLVALARVDPIHMAVINVGDSRLYRLRHDELTQVTSDHNLVAELVAEGRLSPEEAEFHPRRNIMTRALGVDPEVPVDLFEIEAEPGDRYLLCSDGLSDRVNDNLIGSLLRRLADPDEAAQALVDEAKRRGGNDNITVVLVDVVDTDADSVASATAVVPTVSGDGAAHARNGDRPAPPARSKPARTRRITFRVVLFVLILLLLLGGAAAGIAFYARGQYYVGLLGDRVTIFQGQPGGLLWFKPTVADGNTGYTASDLRSADVIPLLKGVQEPSLSAARQYIKNLVAQEQAARAAAAPPTTVAPTTTTGPRRPTTATTKKK